MNKKSRNALDQIEVILDIVLVLLLILIVASVNIQVFTRYITGRGTGWSEVLSRYLFIWIVVLGTASAIRKSEHYTVFFLTKRFSSGLRKKIFIGGMSCVTFFIVTMVITGIKQVSFTWLMWMEGLTVRVGYAYLVIPIGGTIMVIFIGETILKVIKGLVKPFEDTEMWNGENK